MIASQAALFYLALWCFFYSFDERTDPFLCVILMILQLRTFQSTVQGASNISNVR